LDGGCDARDKEALLEVVWLIEKHLETDAVYAVKRII